MGDINNGGDLIVNTHIHPLSGREIEGVRLGDGAVLQDTDRFNGSDGHWTLCLSPGLTIQKGCETIWIRTSAKLSTEGEELLRKVVQNDALLSNFGHWRIIPSIGAKEDGRFGPLEPGPIQELISLGFINKDRNDHQIYRVTNAGQAYLKHLTN